MANKPFVARLGLVVANNVLTTNGSLVGVNTATPSVSLDINTTDAIKLPSGNTGQRPTSSNGMIRYNSQTTSFEGYANNAWDLLGGIRIYDTANTQIYP